MCSEIESHRPRGRSRHGLILRTATGQFHLSRGIIIDEVPRVCNYVAPCRGPNRKRSLRLLSSEFLWTKESPQIAEANTRPAGRFHKHPNLNDLDPPFQRSITFQRSEPPKIWGSWSGNIERGLCEMECAIEVNSVGRCSSGRGDGIGIRGRS